MLDDSACCGDTVCSRVPLILPAIYCTMRSQLFLEQRQHTLQKISSISVPNHVQFIYIYIWCLLDLIKCQDSSRPISSFIFNAILTEQCQPSLNIPENGMWRETATQRQAETFDCHPCWRDIHFPGSLLENMKL